MSAADDAEVETYNPWTIVNLVFTHLAEQGLHPVLGESGDPGSPAATLLLALGIEPAAEGDREVMRDVRAQLAELRAAVFEEADDPHSSHSETPARPGGASDGSSRTQ